MNLTKLVNAMDQCVNGGNCEDCPLNGVKDCTRRLCIEIEMALCHSDEHTYDSVVQYTKHDNLLKWFFAQKIPDGTTREEYVSVRERCSKEREVSMYLYVRHDEDSKCWAIIKCPINPLPIKGEFQIVSTAAIGELLESMGWKYAGKKTAQMIGNK